MFVTFLVIIYTNTNTKNDEKIDFQLREVVLTVQNEIVLAHYAKDGYSRNFSLPSELLWLEYNMSIISNSVYAVTQDSRHAISLDVMNVTGRPQPGNNFIRNLQGIVYLN
jgi:hypothetical protein